MIPTLSVLVGVVLLFLGGELLVRGSIALARALGLSPLVIGLTVVAFATSSPELAASLIAALRGSPAVAIGNVIGSNVANVGLILGIALCLHPVTAHARVIDREIPFMLLATLVLFPVLLDGTVSRIEGLALLLLLGIYLTYLFRQGEAPPTDDLEAVTWSGAAATLAVVGGSLVLLLGAHVLVDGAVTIARSLGVSERVVGLTLVAFGTSLPELASCLVAARKGMSDIVLGNVVGSNIFNILCILGVTATTVPIPVAAEIVRVDFWVMLVFSFLLLPFLSPRVGLGRWAGVLFCLGYVTYVVSLFV